MIQYITHAANNNVIVVDITDSEFALDTNWTEGEPGELTLGDAFGEDEIVGELLLGVFIGIVGLPRDGGLLLDNPHVHEVGGLSVLPSHVPLNPHL